MAPTTAGHFGHSVLRLKGSSTRVPTQITCQTFKEHPGRLWLGGLRLAARFRLAPGAPSKGGGSIARGALPSTCRCAPCGGSRDPPRGWLRAARGAQYSPDRGLVNASSQYFLAIAADSRDCRNAPGVRSAPRGAPHRKVRRRNPIFSRAWRRSRGVGASRGRGARRPPTPPRPHRARGAACAGSAPAQPLRSSRTRAKRREPICST